MEFLDEIEEKFDSDHSKALRKVVGAWLQQRYDVPSFGPPTWRMLVEAIDNPAGGNDHQLAEKIALDHPAGECTIKASVHNNIRTISVSLFFLYVYIHVQHAMHTRMVVCTECCYFPLTQPHLQKRENVNVKKVMASQPTKLLHQITLQLVVSGASVTLYSI